MNSRWTKDERYVIGLYEAAMEVNDPYAVFDRYVIGTRVSLQPKGVNTICALLLQANFIKKKGPDEVYLTKHGEDLALRLRAEK